MGHGQALDKALARAQIPDTASRALLQELVVGTVRWQGLLEALLRTRLSNPAKPLDPLLQALIWVGLYQLRFMRLPPYAAVMETVAATEELGHGWAKGLVNGLLRGVLRMADTEYARFPEWVRVSHPQWLLEMLKADWPADYTALLHANNEVPPLSLRVNQRRGTRAAYLERLRAQNVVPESLPAPASALILSRRPVRDIPGFADGQVSVQDAGAQWVPELLPLAPGDRVLDACAAPGGKSAHLLETVVDTLVALDRTEERVALIRDTLKRLRLEATVLTADAALPEDWWDQRPFQAILADVPCSGTGVIRRHPDIKWLRRPEDIARLVADQLRLVRGLWPTLAVGGSLLYVTCSVLRAENAGVIGAFLEEQADAEHWPMALPVGRAAQYGWQILPGEGSMDGFYYARLRKRPL